MTSKAVRIVGAVGILWNLVGVASYLAYVGLFGDGTAMASEARMPVIVTSAFAISVFAGVIGCVGLAMLSGWAAPVLWLSLAAAVVNWGWVLLYSSQAELPLGISVLVGGLALALIAQRAPRAR